MTARDDYWPPAHVATLKAMVAMGATSREVAEALGGDVTRNAVIGKANRLGLKFKGEGAVSRHFARRIKARAAAAAPPAPAPVDAPAPDVGAVPDSQPRPWLTREPGECAWPIGEPGPAMLSCCAPAAPGMRYCEDHCVIAYPRYRRAA